VSSHTDNESLGGFSIEDIQKEIKRGTKLVSLYFLLLKMEDNIFLPSVKFTMKLFSVLYICSGFFFFF